MLLWTYSSFNDQSCCSLLFNVKVAFDQVVSAIQFICHGYVVPVCEF